MSDAAGSMALARIVAVAAALPTQVSDQVVFIGGTVLPLLVETENRFTTPRSTKDVDAVTAAASYTHFARLEEALREAKFVHSPSGPISRWIAPHGEVFDLTSAGQHLGGTGALVDQWAIDTAVPIPGHPQLRQLSGPGYFLMKAAAFSDRGAGRPSDSKDLADLAVLLVGREGLRVECEAAPSEMRALVSEHARMLLASTDLIGALRGHFADRRPIPPDTPDSLAVESLDVLHALVRIADDI